MISGVGQIIPRRSPLMEKDRDSKKSRGPTRLTYIPSQYREIAGIEKLTTRAQLLRLRDYLEQGVDRRPAYLRLGASVPNYKRYPDQRPSATYVVGYDQTVQIIRFDGDPRQAEHWFSRAERPWNLAREFAVEVRP
jgi:hypothetical protein